MRIIARELFPYLHYAHDRLTLDLYWKPAKIVREEIILAEMEPQLRTIRWKYHGSNFKPSTYSWQFPYLQFIFFNRCLGVAASSRPMKMGDPFHAAPLPNIYRSGLVCQDKANNINEAIAIFFGSCFESPLAWQNCLYFNRLVLHAINNEKFGKIWQEKSRQNPSFVLDFNWHNMPELRSYFFERRHAGTIIPFLDQAITGHK